MGSTSIVTWLQAVWKSPAIGLWILDWKLQALPNSILPNRSWERVAADIHEVDNRKYLVVIDYFCRYIEFAYLLDMTGATVRSRLSAVFTRWGCRIVMVTHNWPQFSGYQFQDFAKAYDFQHVTTRPYFPQKNEGNTFWNGGIPHSPFSATERLPSKQQVTVQPTDARPSDKYSHSHTQRKASPSVAGHCPGESSRLQSQVCL